MINVLDRFNVSVAALTMNKALGLTATTYGLGAGAFFWSYTLFQTPANKVLARVGARRWITGIATAWGLCSAGDGDVDRGRRGFVVARFMLGVAEAGSFPWRRLFHDLLVPGPAPPRGRAMGVFDGVRSSAGILAGPVSANLLAARRAGSASRAAGNGCSWPRGC